MKSELVTSAHLERRAVVYIRQSTPHQVVSNQESLRLQYAFRQRARELGWHEADIDVIDADLGLSGASAAGRSGFKELVGRVGLSEVGLILSIDVTRLARNCSDWYPLLDILRAARLPDRRSRRGLRSRQRQWSPAARSQGDHIRARTAYHPQPPDGRPDRQSRAGRACAHPAGRSRARPERRGREGSRHGRSGAAWARSRPS